MPELPEVETVRRGLEPVLIGQEIALIEVLRDKSWDGKIDEVIGCEIVAVKRKAKILFIETKSKKQETRFLMVHLKMTGQLIYEASKETKNQKLRTNNRIVGGHPSNSWTGNLPDKHTRVVIGLTEGTLYFNDMRVFGWVRLFDQFSVDRLIDKMPPDIIDVECDKPYFLKVLQRSGRAVKQVIMDSAKIGGVGNIYACDGLFDAGIDPRRPSKELTKNEASKLLESLKKVVNLGIELGGATAADGKFVNTQGLGGSYQDRFLVYEQEGELRERGGKKGVVEKFKLGGRGTYWVPNLQN